MRVLEIQGPGQLPLLPCPYADAVNDFCGRWHIHKSKTVHEKTWTVRMKKGEKLGFFNSFRKKTFWNSRKYKRPKSCLGKKKKKKYSNANIKLFIVYMIIFQRDRIKSCLVFKRPSPCTNTNVGLPLFRGPRPLSPESLAYK